MFSTELIITDNGLFHFCKQLHRYHANYFRHYSGHLVCRFDACDIKIPNILTLTFEVLPTIVGFHLGSRKIFSSLENRKYEVIELNEY